jgi:hypothetical protein
MSSRRDSIVADIVAALSTATGKPSGLTVHRQRTLPIGADVLPSQVVYLVDETVVTGPGFGVGANALAVREATVRVESRVSAGASTPDQALDPLLNWAVQKILADPTRGGLAHFTIELGTQWAAADEDKVYGAAQTDFKVKYTTSAADPTAAT